MEKVNFYNKIIGNMNYLEYQFDQALNIIISANKIDISRTNPASEGKKAIFKLDEFAKDNNIDLFEGDNYLKYIYIGFIEAALEEMGDCFSFDWAIQCL